MIKSQFQTNMRINTKLCSEGFREQTGLICAMITEENIRNDGLDQRQLLVRTWRDMRTTWRWADRI